MSDQKYSNDIWHHRNISFFMKSSVFTRASDQKNEAVSMEASIKIIINKIIGNKFILSVIATQPIIGGNAPAAPPITIF